VSVNTIALCTSKWWKWQIERNETEQTSIIMVPLLVLSLKGIESQMQA
jgi:hypothetical protein